MEGAHQLDNGNVRGGFATRGTIRASGLELSGVGDRQRASARARLDSTSHKLAPRASEAPGQGPSPYSSTLFSPPTPAAT